MRKDTSSSAARFATIVAAVDQTPAGLHALRAASMIAEAARGKAFALRVVQDPWEGVRADEVDLLRRQGIAPAAAAEARLNQELQEEIASTVGSARAEAAIRFGTPALDIAAWATRLEADLLVLGRQPPGPLERRPSGRTLASTIEHAKMPCLVVPFGQRQWSKVAAVVDADSGVQVRRVAQRFASLWSETPAELVSDPTPTGITRVLQEARDRDSNVLVVNAGEASGFLERATCAVLTVPRESR